MLFVGHVFNVTYHFARGLYHRSGITPCPEGFYSVVRIISQFAWTMQSTGQTLTHLGESWWPWHSTQVAWSITYRMPSPSLMDSVGHSGTQAPQAMQSSVIFIVMVNTPSKICAAEYKITR